MGKVYALPLESFRDYKDIRSFREKHQAEVIHNHEKLNKFHDDVMMKVVNVATIKIESEWGSPPAHFAFFMMGSAARSEQSVWSDQDHGIIYEEEVEGAQDYFLKLGHEIANGLAIAGYEECDGRVMASNHRWCKSLLSWEEQLHQWVDQESWETIRYMLTFFDSRVFLGKEELLVRMKRIIIGRIERNPNLLNRCLDNVGRVKKAIGLFGHLLPEPYGQYSGAIHVKQAVLFPYVNALRLLALQEGILAPSTITRFHQLSQSYPSIEKFEESFHQLLDFRLRLQKNSNNYEDVHYLPLKQLTRLDKQLLKRFIKDGRALFKETAKIINKGC